MFASQIINNRNVRTHEQMLALALETKAQADRLAMQRPAGDAELQRIRRTHSALHGLMFSWKDKLPGIRGPHWFLVSNCLPRRVTPGNWNAENWIETCVTREHPLTFTKFWDPALLAPCDVRAAAERAEGERLRARQQGDTPSFVLAPFGSAEATTCGRCGLPARMVGRYEACYGSGQRCTEVLRLCLLCPSVTPLGDEYHQAH